jgi:hydrophobic/amphiphilic exporter-1 (mainly G- bacteria), HAE1 family
MNVVEFSIKRRVTVTMIAIAVVIFGLVAFTRLPINLLPDISYPSLTVETRFPGAAPEEVESLVTRPIEEMVGIVSGVRRLTSVSRPGLSQVTLEFEWGRNMDFAALDVRQKLELLALPRETQKPLVLRFDPANEPIVRLFLTGGESLYQLRYVAEEVLKKDLESTDGVAAIKINGGFEEEIQVRVDQGKLSLVGLTIQDVNLKLSRENVNQAGGSLYEEEARYLVRSRNEFTGLDDILQTVLTSRDGRNVRMADVATVVRGHKKRDVITRFGGSEAVELAMYKEGDANTVAVSRSIQNRLGNVKKELPEGIEVITGVDQATFIESSIRQVLYNAVVGGIIAIFVLLLFLRNIRSTLIIGVSIPLSIIATFFLMYQFGITLNIMSLGGLALGVGMLVDNAIVVLEAIFKRKEKGLSAVEASRLGASEVGRAVIASTLTTVAVFVPVVFLEGIAAQLFLDQALTVSFALLASLAVSLTLIPMMAAFVLRDAREREAEVEVPVEGGRVRRAARAVFFRFPAAILRQVRRFAGIVGRLIGIAAGPVGRGFDGVLGRVTRSYPGVLGWALQARWTVVGLAVMLFILSILMVPQLGVDLIPSFAQGEFSFLLELPEGTPIEVTDRTIASVQETLAGDPRIGSFSSIAGGAGLSLSNTGTEGENAGRIYVQMAPGTSKRDEDAVAEELRATLAQIGSARFKFERPSLFTFRTPIEVEIYSDSIEAMHDAAGRVRDAVQRTPGVVDVKSTAELGNPELQVTFDREQLGQLNLNLFEVAGTIRNKIQGDVATRFMQGDREIDILVHSLSIGDASVDDVRDLIIAQRNGRPIYLGGVAEVHLVEGPSEIRRIGQKRAAVVSGNLEGRSMADAAAEIRQTLRGLALPGAVTATLSGQEEEMSRSLNSLLFAMALAIFLVYLVMASQFESFLHPFVIILTLPLGAVGVIWALMLTGNGLTVVSMIGAVMLAGIVVNNAIVLIDAVNRRRAEGFPKRDAIIEAGRDRLRPILMTSMTTVLGLLPMALGLGEGAELRAPLAITVIGGLTMATLLTLIVIPVVYAILDRKVFEADRGVAEDYDSAAVGLGGETPGVVR